MRFSNQQLDLMRTIGDPTLDPIIEGLFGTNGIDGLNASLRAAVSNDRTVPGSLPPKLAEWMKGASQLPHGTDVARLERAAAFFVDHGISISVLLGIASLPECYAARKGVKALHATDQMGYGGTEKRVSETSQFVLQVMMPGGFLPAGTAISTLMKVRMMHSASRILIQSKNWDTQGDGVPINQEDLIGTLTTFGYTPLIHIAKLGVNVTTQQADDFWYFWRVAGELLGLDKDVMPRDTAEAATFVERVKQRHHGKSNEGIELTRALLKTYSNLVPGGALMGGLIAAFMRYLVGDEVADVLEVPRSRWSAVMSGNRLIFKLLNAVLGTSATVHNLANQLGIKILLSQALRISGGRRAAYEIPATIRRAWRLPPYGSAERAASFICRLNETLKLKTGSAQDAADTLIDLAVFVARADGEIDTFEQAALTETMKTFGVPEESLAERLAASISLMKKHTEEARVASVARALTALGIQTPGLQLAIGMAYSNSGIAKEERLLVEQLARKLGLTDAALETLVDETRAQIEEGAPERRTGAAGHPPT